MIERVSLFSSKSEILFALLLTLSVLFLSLALEFYSYKKFTAFDSQLVSAKVIYQYEKTKQTKTGKTKTYQVLKLKSEDGLTFYTIASKNLKPLKNKKIELEIWAGEISFYEYFRTFFAFSKIISIENDDSLRAVLMHKIQIQHMRQESWQIYQALFLAQQLPKELQTHFSNLGISHLIAISGFHLGVLSALLYFVLKYPYKFLQGRYFPFRSYSRDSFVLISFILLLYLLFLQSPPSLLRAFMMLLVGFFFYDRGMKVLSMQTLGVSVLLLLALFPRLFFSLGFWLSVGGVFYIFLFLTQFKDITKKWSYTLLPLWIYLMMLPYSLAIFANFSLYHPLSIVWTSLFVFFYPLSLFLHLIGVGSLLDFVLDFLLHLDIKAHLVELHAQWIYLEILLSALTLYRRAFLIPLLTVCSGIFIYFIYDIT